MIKVVLYTIYLFKTNKEKTFLKILSAKRKNILGNEFPGKRVIFPEKIWEMMRNPDN